MKEPSVAQGPAHAIIESRTAKRPIDLVRYTFVADRVVPRSQTHVRGSGGGGMVGTVGGNTSGYVEPVRISSTTSHTNDVWYTRADGTEAFVWLDAGAVPLRPGQTLTLVFAQPRRSKREPELLVVRNHATGQVRVIADERRAGASGAVRPNLLLFGAAMVLIAIAIIKGESDPAWAVLFVPGLILFLLEFWRMRAAVRRFLKEATAFAQQA